MEKELSEILGMLKQLFPKVEGSFYLDLDTGKYVILLHNMDANSTDYILDQLIRGSLLEDCIVCVN